MAMVRVKNPEFDLHLMYGKCRNYSCGITLALMIAAAIAFPSFEAKARAIKPKQQIISLENIPETQQIKRPPPPPRPAVPIETESADVPDDVTIESTDLPFDEAVFDLPPPPPPGNNEAASEEEEILEFFMVEDKPEMIKSVSPVYPEIARKAGLEGTVYLSFVVDRNGRVRDVVVLKGQEIFRQAAMDAVAQFIFKPAKQNDKTVSVKMNIPIKFTLGGG